MTYYEEMLIALAPAVIKHRFGAKAPNARHNFFTSYYLGKVANPREKSISYLMGKEAGAAKDRYKKCKRTGRRQSAAVNLRWYWVYRTLHEALYAIERLTGRGVPSV